MTEPWQYVRQGDAEAAVIDILKNDTPELPHYPPNPTLFIKANLIGFEPQQRWIVVSQEGAAMTWPHISRPRIDVEVFAERRTIAREIAEIAQAGIFRQMGSYYGFGLFICDVKLEQGLTNIPDKYQNVARFAFAVRLTTVPRGAALSVPFS